MAGDGDIARLAQARSVLEARLIAARHLRRTDRVRLLESELRRLDRRRAALRRAQNAIQA